MSLFTKRLQISLRHVLITLLGVYLFLPIIIHFYGGPLATTSLVNMSSMFSIMLLYVIASSNRRGRMYDAVKWFFESVVSHVLIALAFADVGPLIEDVQFPCGLLGIGMGAMAFMSLIEYLKKWEREDHVAVASATISSSSS